MSRTRSHVPQDRQRRALRRLWWLTLLALTGCDQFLPYDKERRQECAAPDSMTVWTGTDSSTATIQECWDVWERRTAPTPTCTTDSECAAAYPGTNGDPIPSR